MSDSRESRPTSLPHPRVLMLAAPFPPRLAAGTLRTVRFVRYLAEFGWSPIVITVRDPGAGLVDDTMLDQIPEGVVVERARILNPAEALRRSGPTRRQSSAGRAPVPGAPHPAPSGGGLVKELGRRVAAFLEMPDPSVGWLVPAVAAAWRLVRRYDPILIYSTSPPHSSHLVALVASRLFGLPLVLDFRDPWARSPWRDEPGWQRGVHRRLEAVCVRRADRVILNTSRARQEFVEHYGREHDRRFSVIPNGFDPEQMPEVERLLAAASEAPRRSAVRICHPGTVYGRRDLRPVVAAMARLRGEGHDNELEQVGTVAPSAAEGLERLIADLGLTEAVSFVPPVSHAEALERTAAADVLLVLQPGTPLQVPGKLYEMMMFRKPLVVLADDGETSDIVRAHGLGEIADPLDVDAIASAIRRAAARPQVAPVEALREFDGRRLTGRLAAVFDAVASAAGVAPPSRRRSLPERDFR